MSIAELPNQRPRDPNINSVGAEFERTPPQDLIAEQSVLGGMLLSKDAIADVIEIIRDRDFYRPAHELIYDAIIDLYGRGEPADAVTVSAELSKRGDISRAGGAPYLHTLISSVPTAANAGYYAKIVREHAIMRRLVEAGTKIVQYGYTTEGEVDEMVDLAQAEVYAVTERRSSEDYVQLSTLLPQALDEIEAISKGIGVEGVMTGFKDLDQLTHGLHPGNMIILAARPAMGKSTLGLDIARAGGAPYLHTLISSVPTAANAGYYAKIVREHAIMRRLVEAGTKIVQYGYTTEGEVDEMVDLAQAEVYAVTERRSSEDYVQLSTLLPQALDEIEAISKGIGVEGVMTGFKDLDQLTHGLHPGNMIILAARPAMGKSTLGLDIARNASIHNGQTSVIFSLEMSKSEITMRMLSAEARVGLNNIRSGSLSDDEWSRLARRMGEISEAPLFIDDSPNLSMMEIRAKARRLKQRHDLKLIVIDYLQLMSSGKKSREPPTGSFRIFTPAQIDG